MPDGSCPHASEYGINITMLYGRGLLCYIFSGFPEPMRNMRKVHIRFFD